MGDKTKIEWTDATWNPTTGCTKVSAGCANCYIDSTPPFRMDGRKFEHGHIPIKLHSLRLEQPLVWKRHRRIFVNSLSDLFHKDIPDQFRDQVFATIYRANWHTFQVLTKRHVEMAYYFSDPQLLDRLNTVVSQSERADPIEQHWPLPNLHLGVTVENQSAAHSRIPHLALIPAAVRFLSCEPLLGSIDFSSYRTNLLAGISWVIVGGESGPNARAMYPLWPMEIIEQCKSAKVPVFFKQWGEWYPLHGTGVASSDESEEIEPFCWIDSNGKTAQSGSEPDKIMVRIGKKMAGATIYGNTYREIPNG